MNNIWGEIQALIASAPRELEEFDTNAEELLELLPYDQVLGHYRDVPPETKRIYAAHRQLWGEVRLAAEAHAYTDSHIATDEDCRAFHREMKWLQFKAYLLKLLFFAGTADHIGLSPMDKFEIRSGGEIVTIPDGAVVEYLRAQGAFGSVGKC